MLGRSFEDAGARGLRPGAFVVLLCTSGCQVVLGIDEWPAGFGGASTSTGMTAITATANSSSASAMTASSSTGANVPCGNDGLLVCSPTVPVADGTWSVPGAFVDGGSGSCPFLPAGAIELAASVAPSTCACEAPQPPLCSTVAVISDAVGCTSMPHADASICNLLPSGGGSVLATAVDSANCSSPGFVPPPALESPRVLCAPMPDPTCGANEVCVPFGGRVCIVHDGLAPCPAGYHEAAGSPFTKLDYYDCGTCVRPASQCGGTTRVWADMGCSSATTTIVPNDGACAQLGFAAQSFEWFPDANNDVPSCGPVPQYVQTSTHTVCCL